MPDDRTPTRRALDRVLVRVLLGREHHSPAAVMVDAADALEAEGWRPRARVITDPAELEKLPMDSIVVDHHGAGWQMTDRYYGDTAIWEYRATAKDSAELLAAGARVHLVHVPIKEADRG